MCWDPQMRFLIIGAIATFLVSRIEDKENSHNNGGLEALALIGTLFAICSIDSITSKKCEDDISKLTTKIYNQKVNVFRDGNEESFEIEGFNLIVGDVYTIRPGMMIPADSILIQVGESLEEVDNPYI